MVDDNAKRQGQQGKTKATKDDSKSGKTGGILGFAGLSFTKPSGSGEPSNAPPGNKNDTDAGSDKVHGEEEVKNGGKANFGFFPPAARKMGGEDTSNNTGSGSGRGSGEEKVKNDGKAKVWYPPPAAVRHLGTEGTSNQPESHRHGISVPASETQNPIFEETSQKLQKLKNHFPQTTPSIFKTMDGDAIAESIAAHYADYKDPTGFLSTSNFIKAFFEENPRFTAESILSDTAGFEENLTEVMACVADDNPMKYDLPPKLSEYLQAIKDRNPMSWFFNPLKALFGQ